MDQRGNFAGPSGVAGPLLRLAMGRGSFASAGVRARATWMSTKRCSVAVVVDDISAWAGPRVPYSTRERPVKPRACTFLLARHGEHCRPYAPRHAPPPRHTRGAPPVARKQTPFACDVRRRSCPYSGAPPDAIDAAPRRRQSHKAVVGTRVTTTTTLRAPPRQGPRRRHSPPQIARAAISNTPPARFHAPSLPTPQTPKYRRPVWT